MKVTPRDALDLFKRSGTEFFRDDCPRLAAALSYYTVFALAPLIALLLLMAGLIWNPQEVQSAIGHQIRDLMGEQASREVLTMVAHKDPTGGRGPMATIIGLAMLAFGATGAFLQLQGALNAAWDVEPDPSQGGIRNFVTKRVFSFGLILGIVFLLIVSLAVTAAVSAITDRFGGGVNETVMLVLEFVFAFLVVTFLFGAMFKVLPDAEVAWRDVWVGAIVDGACGEPRGSESRRPLPAREGASDGHALGDERRRVETEPRRDIPWLLRCHGSSRDEHSTDEARRVLWARWKMQERGLPFE